MERIDNYSENKISAAKDRVKQLKDFYSHLATYIMVNTLISIFRMYSNWEDGDSILDLHVFSVWFWWGIGLAIHAVNTFQFLPFLGKDWEERKINEYMNKNRR